MKTVVALLGLVLSVSAFAANPPVAIQGQSTLKLGEDNTIRNARKVIAALDVEIAKADKDIEEAQSQAVIYKAMPSNGNLLEAQMNTLASGLKSHRAQLLTARAEMQAQIQETQKAE